MKQPKINGIKQEFDILHWDSNFEHIRVNNEKGNDEDLYIMDREGCKKWDLSKMKRGLRLVAIASRGKNKTYGKKVVTHIQAVLPSKQIDLIDYLQETKC